MHALWRGALTALLLVVVVGPGAELMAQAPAVEATRPSFRDMRRLEPVHPAQPTPSARPALPSASPQKEPPSATPFAGQPAADRSGADKGLVEKAASAPDKVGPERTGRENSPTPVKASVTPPKPAWLKQLPPGACGLPSLTAKALPAGRMQVLLASPCRAREAITWRYGGAARQTKLDGEGRVDLTVEGFAGTSTPVEIVLADGTRAELPFEAEHLGGVTKVALIWRGPVDLDLHAFEHAAAPGKAGHVWPGAASSAVDAVRSASQGSRGSGFLSAAAPGGDGDQVEVYTFVHGSREAPGHIAFAVHRNVVALEAPHPKPPHPKPANIEPGETESSEIARPDAPVAAAAGCNPSTLAEVPFRLIVAAPGQPPVTSRGIVAAADCGPAPHTVATFDTALLPALRLGSR